MEETVKAHDQAERTGESYRPRPRLRVGRLGQLGLFLIVLYALSHLAGWRPYTCILSGTFPDGDPDPLKIVAGVLYVLLHLLAIVVAPILIIAGVVRYAIELLLIRRV